jgi:hypothetical protein
VDCSGKSPGITFFTSLGPAFYTLQKWLLSERLTSEGSTHVHGLLTSVRPDHLDAPLRGIRRCGESGI